MDRNIALLIAALLAFATARADQHIYEPTTFESGSSLSITTGVVLDGTWDFSGATVLGLGGAGGSVTSVFTRIGAVVALSTDYAAFYQPLDADLTGWAAKTPYAGNLTITSGQTLNVTSGGTLGTAAYTATGAYEVPLTFSQSLNRATNTVTLQGDSASPGNSRYYGTDSGGTKGWFAVPATGTGTVTNITTTAPIQGGPITTTGAINLDPTKVTAWDLANTDRLKWDGGSTGLTPATGRTSLGLGTAAIADAAAFKSAFTFGQSLQQPLEGNTATLVGDVATPGNSKYYGTNNTGNRGFFDLPTAGTGDVVGPASAVDSELAIFSGTSGKIIKRGTGTGLAKVTSGVLSTVTDNSSNWNTAYTERAQWDGGATNLNAANGRSNLGASQIGDTIFTMPAPVSLTAWMKLTNGGAVVREDAATTRTSLGLGSAATANTGDFETAFNFTQSLSQSFDGGNATLTGDTAAPGNSKYYGTDGSGTRGWYALPAAGGTGDVTGPGSSTDSQIAIFSGTTGKAIKTAAGSGLAKISAGVLGTTADNSANWDTAYSERAQWDGGSTNLNAGNGRTSLGATSTGSAIFTIAPPVVISWIRLNTLGGVVTESASTTRTSLGLGTAALNNTGDFEVPLTFAFSLNNRVGNTVALVGDTSAPGGKKYYGTDGAGTRGFFDLNSLGGGDFSSNTSTSVANELVLFADATGKIGKRPGAVNGLALLTNGVLGAVNNGSNNWDTAYTDRLKWDPSLGLTGGTAAQARTALGASSIGGDIFTRVGPGSTSWIKASALGTIAYEDAGTTRTSLGLAIGTNVQAWDTDLDAWAAKGAPPTGAAVGTTDVQTLTNKEIVPRINTVSDASTTITPNIDSYDMTVIDNATSTAITIANPTGTAVDGQQMILRLKSNNSATAKVLTWGTQYGGGNLPSALAYSSAGLYMNLTFRYNANEATTKWKLVESKTEGGFASFQTATYQSPTAITSTTGLMAGLGSASWGSNAITPQSSGKVLVTASGGIYNSLAAGSAQASIRYGTGTAPNNAAALAGTATVPIISRGAVGASITTPLSVTALITGLQPGTPYWLDLGLSNASTSGAVSLIAVTMTAVELP